jgi:beta-aspartyl-peptidase (threonine type)
MHRLIAVSFGIVVTVAAMSAPTADPPVKWAIAIHGGAGVSEALKTEAKADLRRQYEDALRAAVSLGSDHLAQGGTALDAVEKVIRAMEDDPLFNAGKGACYNLVGKHELDASIMDGQTLACGAVAGVRTVKNPISLARLVMTKTKNVLYIMDGAEEFATRMGVERVENSYFDTPKEWATYQRWLERQKKQAGDGAKGGGTVGCLCLDVRGHLAAGTSTGGVTGKPVGRVGDSPIIGAGTFADDRTCAVSCSGTGEEFIRHGVARTIANLVEFKGLSIQRAGDELMHKTLKPDIGGCIILGKAGDFACSFNTDGMFRGYANSNGVATIGIWK